MKKSQLKQTLKPIIKECIKEVFLEQGMLSGIIAEVVKGIRPLQEQQRPQPQTPSQHNNTLKFQQQQLEEQRQELEEERYLQLKEQKKKLLNATGLPANVFEGVTPLAKGGNADAKHEGTAGALADVEPHDPGVDISGIMALGGHKWSKLI